jgi:hypothetical protein
MELKASKWDVIYWNDLFRIVVGQGHYNKINEPYGYDKRWAIHDLLRD